jgi:hypothetical protein
VKDEADEGNKSVKIVHEREKLDKSQKMKTELGRALARSVR